MPQGPSWPRYLGVTLGSLIYCIFASRRIRRFISSVWATFLQLHARILYIKLQFLLFICIQLMRGQIWDYNKIANSFVISKHFIVLNYIYFFHWKYLCLPIIYIKIFIQHANWIYNIAINYVSQRSLSYISTHAKCNIRQEVNLLHLDRNSVNALSEIPLYTSFIKSSINWGLQSLIWTRAMLSATR